jgi:hypothetical protein
MEYISQEVALSGEGHSSEPENTFISQDSFIDDTSNQSSSFLPYNILEFSPLKKRRFEEELTQEDIFLETVFLETVEVPQKRKLKNEQDITILKNCLHQYVDSPIFSGYVQTDILKVDPTNRNLYGFHIEHLKSRFKDGINFDSNPPIIIGIHQAELDEWFPKCIKGESFSGLIIVVLFILNIEWPSSGCCS